MAKSITARDLVVIKVITAFAPNVAELTIRYDYLLDDPTKEDQEWIAYVRVPGNQLFLKLMEDRRKGGQSQWIPIWLDVPRPRGQHFRYRPGTYEVMKNLDDEYVFSLTH